MTIPLIDTLSRQGGANFPIALGEDVIGAFVTVATTGARDAIPTNVLRVGAIVRISNTSSYYEWNGSAWVSVSFGGGGGGTSTGGGMGFRYTYAGSGTVADADPGAGVFRGNNAALSSVTTLFVDLLEYGGTDVTAWLDSLDDYVGAVKGVIRLSSQSDATKWIEYTVTGWTTATGYRKLTVAYKDGPGGITATVGDTFIAFDYTSISGNLAGGALTNVKSVTYGSAPVDNGNSGTADTIDWTAGDIQKSTLTGNCTYTFTAPLGIGGFTLEIIQDATGARTLAWPATVDWVGGITPTIDPAPNAITIVSFYYNGTRYRGYSAQGSSGGGASSIDWKDSVRFATTAAIAASTRTVNTRTANANGAFPTVDGVIAVVGDRFLDKDNATGADRGIWTITNLGSGATSWVINRAIDADASAEVTSGMGFVVTEGTANGGKIFLLTTADPITLNTTSLTFTALSGSVAGTVKADGTVPLTATWPVGSQALTGVKSITYGAAPVDNGNSGTADTIDWSAGDIQKSTLTGNVTYTFTAPLGIGGFTLEIIQDATGGRTITWPATVDWVGGTAPTIGAAAAAVTVISFYYNGARYRGYSGSGGGGGGGGTAGDGLTGTSTLSVLPNGTTLSVAPAGVKLRNGAAAGQELLWDGTAWQLIGRKTGTALGDASVTVQFTTAAQYIWPAATNTTAARNITLGTTGLAAGPNAGVGAIINVFLLRASYANAIAFINGGAGAGTLFTLPAVGADPVAVSFFYDGTNWSLAGWEFLTTVTAA